MPGNEREVNSATSKAHEDYLAFRNTYERLFDGTRTTVRDIFEKLRKYDPRFKDVSEFVFEQVTPDLKREYIEIVPRWVYRDKDDIGNKSLVMSIAGLSIRTVDSSNTRRPSRGSESIDYSLAALGWFGRLNEPNILMVIED